MACIAIIPARGGSRRIQRKNIKLFHGKPIIAFSIEAAKESRLFDEIYVSTEDEEIARVAMSYGINWLQRPAELADSETGTRAVMVSAVNQLRLADTDMVCCLYATSPLMSADDIRIGHSHLVGLNVAHAISIGYPPLQDAAQFYWSTVDALRIGIEYFGAATALVRIDPERVCDINVPEDWTKAEQMYAALQEKK